MPPHPTKGPTMRASGPFPQNAIEHLRKAEQASGSMATHLITLVLLIKEMQAEQISLFFSLGKRHYAIKMDSSLIN